MIISGGGTGGHLFPGIAIAKEMVNRFSKADILFVTGRRKMESEILEEWGFRQRAIPIEGLKGRGWIRGLTVLFKLPYSCLQALRVVKRFQPHVVVGVGGYSSGPVCLAAKILGIPAAIHEQNSFPGLTNRLLCRFVDRIFISFEGSGRYFRGGVPVLTGNPIREELFRDFERPKKADGAFTLLVVGGSQGARAVNLAVVESLEILKQKSFNVKVIHQTGEVDYSRVVDAYEKKGLQGDIVPFIRDMGAAYGKADLVIGRAGATTVSELAALGIPSILIPYPYSANDHQVTNARALADRGGAEMIHQKDLSGEGLATLIMGYIGDKSALKQMAEQARRMGRADSAKIIVDRLLEMTR